MPDVHLSDTWALRNLIPDFDPSIEYSPRELLILTEKILDEDPKPAWEQPMYLNGDMFLERSRREIYCTQGFPEPHIQSGLYWRAHPNGRRIHSDEQRGRGASYYA